MIQEIGQALAQFGVAGHWWSLQLLVNLYAILKFLGWYKGR